MAKNEIIKQRLPNKSETIPRFRSKLGNSRNEVQSKIRTKLTEKRSRIDCEDLRLPSMFLPPIGISANCAVLLLCLCSMKLGTQIDQTRTKILGRGIWAFPSSEISPKN